jgi:putative transposase
VVEALSREHARPARTIRHWFAQYTRHGMLGLVNRDRADKGTFKLLNEAARKWIVAQFTPKRGSYGALSTNETYRAYEEERVWRDAHIGSPIPSKADEYAAYLDEDHRLSEKCRLPVISLRTLRRFVDSIPEAARTLARDGEEAYRNTQEIISHRDIAAVDPLQFLVMDHRVLDIFSLIPERGGWRLGRPWLTAAIDMRTRRWLGWGIFETPSSDSIATVLKKVFIEHGIPRSVYWDNGKDFRCEYLEGRHVRSEQSGAVGDLDAA